jgi:DNA-binding IclR family transcriptional regulator
MAGNSTDPGRSVTSKVTAILMAFTDGAVHTLTEIAGIAKLPTSTAHRLAAELLAWRLLERTEEGGYRIGLPLRIIGKDATDFDILNRAILVVRARPVLVELARTTRTDAKLGALQGHEVVYLGHSTLNPGGAGDGGTVTRAPAVLPAHETAIGKALLAFSPTSVVDRVLADGLRLHTANTVTSPDNLRHALSVIRLTQIATSRDEYQAGRSAIAMPVFSGGGKVAAAIELTVRDPGTDIRAATGALTVACRSLSRQLATEFRDHGTGCGNGNGSTTLCKRDA